MTSPGLTMSQRQFSFGFWNNGDWGAVFINGLPTGRKQERCQKRTDAHRVFLKESLITLDLTVCNRRTQKRVGYCLRLAMPCRCLGRSNSYCEVFPCRLPEEKSAACYPHGCRSRSNYRHFAAPGEPLPSATFEFGNLPVEERAHAEIRSIMKGKLVTGESVEVHESTLPNGFSHAPHHHAHSEIWLIREGTLQLTINATPPVLGPGGLGFVRSNEKDGIRNVETTTANYYVVAIGPGADTQA